MPGFGRGGFGPGGFGGGGRRAKRGDIRVAILLLVAEKALHGYEILRELGTRSGGLWRPSPGSVYPTLQLLEDEGLIKGAVVDDKRVFSITPAGEKELAARTTETPPWESLGESDEMHMDLRDASLRLGEAAMQVSASGSTDLAKKALAVLKDARRKLYELLAQED